VAAQSSDYQSNIRWFLGRGNAPTGSVRAQLNSLQASLVHLFQDAASTKDDDLGRLGTSLLTEYHKAFQSESPSSIQSIANTLEEMYGVLSKKDKAVSLVPVTDSLKHAVLQLIDLAVEERDERLGRQVLELARRLSPVKSQTETT
jgi:hypothetical protein